MRSFLLALTLALAACTAHTQAVNIIPKPASLTVQKGSFGLSKKTVIAVADEGDRNTANFLNDYLQRFYGLKLDVDKQEGKNYIRLVTRKFIQPEKDGYSLKVTADGVTIEGNNYASTFHGLQTLIQLLPVTDDKSIQWESLPIPFVTVQDAPRFAYRGLHLDVGRHIFPLDFIKKYIDYIALHKMNTFHWHLTEDQGWRIEIKKYPELTQVGAYRNGTIIGRYPGTGNDNIRYGGFYTQDEVKEIVQYAADRHITVVPEIEMPGHASAAIATYPWLSCFPDQPTHIPGPASEKSKQTGGKLVQETWGVFDDVFCAGKDSTFIFLQNVLDEVLTLFPSKLIHIGGDESPKTHWKKCPQCQKRIKEEGLKDEHELQSYFVQRMEKYLNSKGRTIIGWDEILEGGLAPNAVVMSWRGVEGGIAAAQQAHEVIMTPTSHVYFDYSQSQFEDSVIIGGYVPIEKVYNYEPVPKELTAEQGKYIMGAQANMWTEYMKNPRKVEYMLLPRLAALSEVLWSDKEVRNWNDFENRLPAQYRRYDLWGSNYSTAYYDMQASLSPAPNHKGVVLKLSTKDKAGKLTYGVTKKHFQKNYTAPVTFTESGEVVALYTNRKGFVDTAVFNLNFNKATGKKITLAKEPSRSYPGDGAFTLVNGITNTAGLTRSRDFLGFNNSPLEAVIDLGSAQTINHVVVHGYRSEGSWIYAPANAEVWTSADGKNFKQAGSTTTFNGPNNSNGKMEIKLPTTSARFVKVIVNRLAKIPDDMPGAGHNAWLFVDEIEIH